MLRITAMAYTKPGETRKKIYEYVRSRILSGDPPTVREVQEAFSFRSVQTAREHLDILVKDGMLDKEPKKSRAYRIADRTGLLSLSIPLLGRVQAGELTTAIEDLEGYIDVQASHSHDQLFGLRVQGDSMCDAGILPGDIAIVRKQPTAESGDIVVALIEDEATVKTLRIKAGRPELHPANPAYQPIIPQTGELHILGKVIEVRRYFEPIALRSTFR
jgi:repressor LexA